MAENAVWHVTLDGANTAAMAFSSLTMPSALGYQISGTGEYSGETTLLSGPTALPEIEWTVVSPTRRYLPKITADGTGVFLRGRGMRLTSH